MSNLQHASLVLTTATSSVSNASKTSFTWNNIDLRLLLGDMYNKYDRFNLCLNTIASGISGDAGAGHIFFNQDIDAQVLVRVSGLSWVNNTYTISATGANNTGYAILASYKFLNDTQQVEYFYGSNMASFGKNQDLANITIDYIRMSDLAQPVNTEGHPFPAMNFIFDIYGIDDFKINQMDQRIIR